MAAGAAREPVAMETMEAPPATMRVLLPPCSGGGAGSAGQSGAAACPNQQLGFSAHAAADDHAGRAAESLSRKLAAQWRRFAARGKTTRALARAYGASGITADAVRAMPFDDLAAAMQSPALLQAAGALLHRLETRLAISSSSSLLPPMENVDHLLKRLGPVSPPKRKPPPPPPAKKEPGARATTARRKPAAINTSASGLPGGRYPIRVVLCAYMILAHPGAVLSGRGEAEAQLAESAAAFVGEFDLLTKAILDDHDHHHHHHHGNKGLSLRARLAGFDAAWCAYLCRFVAWKTADARVLEDDLVRAACKLELSMLRTCRPGDLSHDAEAIRRQVADDQRLLRGKVRQLGGGAGVARMDAAVAEARAGFLEAQEKGTPLATPVTNVCTPLSIGSPPPAKATTMPTENERIVNEMLHEDYSASAAAGTVTSTESAAAAADKDFQKRVREAMEKAFWDLVTESMRGDKPDHSQLIGLVKEVRDSLHELAPKSWKEEILASIDLEILSQVLDSGSQDLQYLGQILHYSLDMVRKLSAAAKEDEMKRSHGKLLNDLAAAGSGAHDGNGASSFAVAVIRGLRFVLEEIRELRAEVSRAHVQLMQPFIRGPAGVEYLQKAFAGRHGPPAGASASLPLTRQWISASKNVVENEWREHLQSVSALPSQAPALVQVLRAGHGAAIRQPPPPPAGASGQPECKGERLDKLVRIGLLQLVGGVEGLQMQSIPESFQINLMRLRAVQGQFQQAIVIATSMLILRQVLMSENSKATAAELESAVSELFTALVKTLDSSPDAGTGEIVEAMAGVSASVGSPSDEKVQARKQMIARVFLKSLQPGDVILKKVSRAVHCTFRGVVLGGSGAKGRKLADAALRRVSAGKVAGRVVKAAEVLIKVATVSGKVHGPWYNALL